MYLLTKAESKYLTYLMMKTGSAYFLNGYSYDTTVVLTLYKMSKNLLSRPHMKTYVLDIARELKYLSNNQHNSETVNVLRKQELLESFSFVLRNYLTQTALNKIAPQQASIRQVNHLNHALLMLCEEGFFRE